MMPSPWIIIGFLLALAGAFFGGDMRGHSRGVLETDAKWSAIELQRKDAAAKQMTDATQRYVDAEAKNALQTQEWEKKDNDRENYIHGLRIANGRLVAAAGGLFDRNGRPTGNGAAASAGSTAGATGDPPQPAAGCRLSDELSDFLQSRFADADAAAAYAQAGHDYAEAVKAWRESHIPKLTAATNGHR